MYTGPVFARSTPLRSGGLYNCQIPYFAKIHNVIHKYFLNLKMDIVFSSYSMPIPFCQSWEWVVYKKLNTYKYTKYTINYMHILPYNMPILGSEWCGLKRSPQFVAGQSSYHTMQSTRRCRNPENVTIYWPSRLSTAADWRGNACF